MSSPPTNRRGHRVAAILAVLSITAGLLAGGPAAAAPPATSPPVTSPPVTSPPVTSPPGSTPTDLQSAVARDLELSWDDYLERGRQAERAAVLDERLSDTPGYLGVTIEADEVVVTGTGPAVDEAASTDGGRQTGSGSSAPPEAWTRSPSIGSSPSRWTPAGRVCWLSAGQERAG